jgi:hypothetical protein
MKIMRIITWTTFGAFSFAFALFFLAAGMKMSEAGSAGLDRLRSAPSYGYLAANPLYGTSFLQRGRVHSVFSWITLPGAGRTCTNCHTYTNTGKGGTPSKIQQTYGPNGINR